MVKCGHGSGQSPGAAGSSPAIAHASQAGGSSSSSTIATPTAPTSAQRRTLPQKRKAAEEFIALAQYGEDDLLADYRFLSQVSRFAEQAGRDLVQSRIIRAGPGGSIVPLSQAAQSALGAGGPGGAGGPHDGRQHSQQQLSPAQQRAEALKKQLAYRRIPIMLLPEGMRKRRRNQSSWRGREKEMMFTVEVKFPNSLSPKGKDKAATFDTSALSDQDDAGQLGASSGAQADESGRWQDSFLIPYAPGSARLTALVGAEVLSKAGVKEDGLPLAKRSKKQKKSSMRDGEKQINEGPNWRLLDDDVWDELGLDYCEGDSPDDVAAADGEAAPTRLLPPGTQLLIPLYPMKLRNESSLKYLQWYQRHGKTADDGEGEGSGEAHQTAAVAQAGRTILHIPPDCSFSLEDVLRKIPWGWGLVEYPTIELWSEHGFQEAVQLGELAPLDFQSSNGPEAPPEAESQGDGEPASSADPNAERVSSIAAVTTHQLRRNVNEGASSQHVRAAPYLTARTMTHATTAAGPSTLIKAPPAVRRGGTLGATAMLVGYASSDDSEDGDDDDEDDDDGPPEEVSSKPPAASDAPDAPTLAQGLPLESDGPDKGAGDAETAELIQMEENAEVGGEDVEENEEEMETDSAQPGGGGSLAALVQQLGWASR
ncbi:Box C/D snoRNA accumulation [Tilletia horrida]|nr:Box C/D snoRNA accumulation [Tilletia horrida]